MIAGLEIAGLDLERMSRRSVRGLGGSFRVRLRQVRCVVLYVRGYVTILLLLVILWLVEILRLMSLLVVSKPGYLARPALDGRTLRGAAAVLLRRPAPAPAAARIFKGPRNHSSPAAGLDPAEAVQHLCFLWPLYRTTARKRFKMLMAALTSRFQKSRLQSLLRQRFNLKQFLSWCRAFWHQAQSCEV